MSEASARNVALPEVLLNEPNTIRCGGYPRCRYLSSAFWITCALGRLDKRVSSLAYAGSVGAMGCGDSRQRYNAFH